ncbi:hypothetical protein [Pseudomonas sp. RIT-PI-AD]|uniref:hypothetical protein n=1 Tax=Pseudomonas sp. RIT-PI-AD TaxID=3035294 RepID=UPI0021DA898F|nr:hypothetical protein [Pseudomonas sp. RIT-PI-AD]
MKTSALIAFSLSALLAGAVQAAGSAPGAATSSPSGPATGPNAPVINNPTTVTPQAPTPNGNANPARRNGGGVGGSDAPQQSQDDYDRQQRNGQLGTERQQSGQDMVKERTDRSTE